jgi:thiamine-phosphate pyrophosphorylase
MGRGDSDIADLLGFMDLHIPRLYAIIDAEQIGEASPRVICQALLTAGIRLIQYRDKKASSRDLFTISRELQVCVRQAGGMFIVNDRADVALAVDADGVHLGQDDLPVELARRVLGKGSVIGLSTHSADQVSKADATSADYLAFGPIFLTQTKENPDPVVGLAGLRQARKLTRKPLVAIGGITLENAPSVLAAGADSIAVIRDLLQAPDVAQRAREFLRVCEEAATHR